MNKTLYISVCYVVSLVQGEARVSGGVPDTADGQFGESACSGLERLFVRIVRAGGGDDVDVDHCDEVVGGALARRAIRHDDLIAAAPARERRARTGYRQAIRDGPPPSRGARSA